MRVIAGSARSLPLKTVPGTDIRPTTDKTKETLFNILMPYINGSRFLDLFSGSGAIGIEAISRGCLEVVFVDNFKAAWKCIDDNLTFTKFKDQAELIKSDAVSAVKRLEGGKPFDIIFMDPPYDKSLEKDVLEALSGSSLVHEDTIIIVEASLKTSFDYIEELGYTVFKDKKYKNNRHLFLKKA
ncbi:MAG: 16S rRNA (guanine(966)-N(2))-methyltransferase RsmD [Lachnospiraceae bacterium]|nr:16S rRNA (guanine(966)-N(2))-methyltransferase RsmD [Candidatus Equihabitans merdae]